MLMPSIFGEDLLDDFMGQSFGGHSTNNLMNTDVKETDTGYEVTMNLRALRKKMSKGN